MEIRINESLQQSSLHANVILSSLVHPSQNLLRLALLVLSVVVLSDLEEQEVIGLLRIKVVKQVCLDEVVVDLVSSGRAEEEDNIAFIFQEVLTAERRSGRLDQVLDGVFGALHCQQDVDAQENAEGVFSLGAVD